MYAHWSPVFSYSDFDLNIVADANNAERRISFVDLTSPSTTMRVTANAEQQICRTVIAYVLVSIMLW